MANLPLIRRGNTYRFTYTHLHNSVPETLEDATVIFTVKEDEGDDSIDDSTALIQVVTSQHPIQTGDTLGKTVITCTPAQTLNRVSGEIIEAGQYTYDIKIIHADGTQFTEAEGKIKVDIAPTNRIS